MSPHSELTHIDNVSVATFTSLESTKSTFMSAVPEFLESVNLDFAFDDDEELSDYDMDDELKRRRLPYREKKYKETEIINYHEKNPLHPLPEEWYDHCTFDTYETEEITLRQMPKDFASYNKKLAEKMKDEKRKLKKEKKLSSSSSTKSSLILNNINNSSFIITTTKGANSNSINNSQSGIIDPISSRYQTPHSPLLLVSDQTEHARATRTNISDFTKFSKSSISDARRSIDDGRTAMPFSSSPVILPHTHTFSNKTSYSPLSPTFISPSPKSTSMSLAGLVSAPSYPPMTSSQPPASSYIQPPPPAYTQNSYEKDLMAMEFYARRLANYQNPKGSQYLAKNGDYLTEETTRSRRLLDRGDYVENNSLMEEHFSTEENNENRSALMDREYNTAYNNEHPSSRSPSSQQLQSPALKPLDHESKNRSLLPVTKNSSQSSSQNRSQLVYKGKAESLLSYIYSSSSN